jgi:hypothetical protein
MIELLLTYLVQRDSILHLIRINKIYRTLHQENDSLVTKKEPTI